MHKFQDSPFAVSESDLHGKSPELISHVQLEGTAVFETPLERLREHPITPTELLFMRNSYTIPAVAQLLDDTLGIVGLVEYPLMLEISRLPLRSTLETVVQCAGNGRRFFRDSDGIEGSPWERGGVANVQFTGVWLRDVLSRGNIRPEARFLTARGHDGEGDLCYEKSVPLEDALERGFLARALNGQPLSRIHGGPLRLVVPGYYATVNVKWLSTLILTEHETQNEAQQQRYRMPDGSACWRMPLKSVVWSPLEGESLPGGPVRVSGVAWNDGEVALERVEVSIDRGTNWQSTVLERFSDRPQPEWPHLDPQGERYAWTRWSLDLELEPGQHEVWCRAVDAEGTPQLLDGNHNWNAQGYGFCGADRVSFEVR